MSDVYDILGRIISVYNLLILILGTIGNLLSFKICFSKSLRKTPTFIFLAAMLITDTLALYSWNIDHFIQTFWGFMLDDLSLAWCKETTFLQCFSFQASAWLLVAMTIERYLSVKIKTWRLTVFNSNKAGITALTIVFIWFVVNVQLFFTIEPYIIPNITTFQPCHLTKMHILWLNIHIYLYSLVPFGILCIANIFMLYQTIYKRFTPNSKNTTSNKKMSKQTAVTVSVVAATFAFIVLTLPSTIAGGYYLGQLLSTGTFGIFILLLVDALSFSYHAFDFLVFLILNKQFRREFIGYFKIKVFHRGTISPQTFQNTLTMTNTVVNI